MVTVNTVAVTTGTVTIVTVELDILLNVKGKTHNNNTNNHVTSTIFIPIFQSGFPKTGKHHRKKFDFINQLIPSVNRNNTLYL